MSPAVPLVVYSFVGIETRPNEMVAVPIERAGMETLYRAAVHERTGRT